MNPLLSRFRLVAAVLLAVGMGGCASPDREPLRVPVTSERADRQRGVSTRAATLLVFLPGRGTRGEDFFKQGFVAALPDAPVTSIAVDLTFPYYMQRIATQRLHEDVIVPARAAGFRNIWLVGCSIGGLGAIMYAHEHPGEINGIVVLAPYLGEKNVVGEIEAAGGLARWQPKGPLAADDFQRPLWLAIKAERFDQPGRLPLVLGYGTHDRFVYGHRLLAAQLPTDHVFTVFGFHDWGTWHRLWVRILQSPVSPLVGQKPMRSAGATPDTKPAS